MHSQLFRHDVKLAITPTLAKLLLELSRSPLLRAVARGLGDDAALCELSCIISEGGAQPQPAHADTPVLEVEAKTEHHRMLAQNGARLLSVFVALGNISPSMGPTVMWPATHKTDVHKEVHERGKDTLRNATGVLMDLNSGNAVLMDSRLWHCGSGNTENGVFRCVLVATFTPTRFFPVGATYCEPQSQ